MLQQPNCSKMLTLEVCRPTAALSRTIRRVASRGSWADVEGASRGRTNLWDVLSSGGNNTPPGEHREAPLTRAYGAHEPATPGPPVVESVEQENDVPLECRPGRANSSPSLSKRSKRAATAGGKRFSRVAEWRNH